MEESEYSSEGGGEVEVEGARGGRRRRPWSGRWIPLWKQQWSWQRRGWSGGFAWQGGGWSGGRVDGVEALVADGDGIDGGGGDEREDVGGDPRGGDKGVGGKGGDVIVGSAKDDGYVGTNEGPDDVLVGTVHPDLSDGAWPSLIPYQPALGALSPSLPQRLLPLSTHR